MISDLIRDGWGYHDTESERLAGELEAADLGELKGEGPGHCLRLSNHTIGEHLGDWPRARRFAEAVRDATADQPPEASFGAHLAVARYMDGDTVAAQQAEIECLGAAEHPVDAYLTVKSFLAGALAGTGRFADAGMVIAAANRLAMNLGDEATSNRSMAVTNNNLASELSRIRRAGFGSGQADDGLRPGRAHVLAALRNLGQRGARPVPAGAGEQPGRGVPSRAATRPRGTRCDRGKRRRARGRGLHPTGCRQIPHRTVRHGIRRGALGDGRRTRRGLVRRVADHLVPR